MSQQTQDVDADAVEELEDEVEVFLMSNFPQIQMHGGDAEVEAVDLEAGTATVELSGACSGCGISPQTVQAIKTRMTKEIAVLNSVEVNITEEDDSESMVVKYDPDENEVPF